MIEKKKVTAHEIYDLLLNDFKIKEQIGSVEIIFGGISARYKGRDALGDLIQEWIGKWLSQNNIFYRTKINTQEFPDFLLSEDDDKGFLEIKTFNANASPAFDIANFNAYSQSLLSKPERLDADYLILSYKMIDGALSIDNIWLKKVWEIAGSSGTNPINLQTKYSQPYNLRPIKWYGKTNKNKPFEDKLSFLKAIAETHNKYENTSKSYSENWLEKVCSKYFEHTGIKL
ncbi:NgoBV family restriction endonuclease [Arcicella rigui]|uniref:NgoBV family restriction endonuclease n=1 Tax=Arcicella rigui TaxID=797020 RepID=A0ABU5QC76_9BACT|nr:NgoBV family restriction endonuclease [Arcicella rigui]MEA5140451.1 NgoBV family restriction endonuclease [Arcicella rigui]